MRNHFRRTILIVLATVLSSIWFISGDVETISLTLARALAQATQGASISEDGIWQDIDEAPLKGIAAIQAERRIVPRAYRVLRLNREALRQIVDHAPMEFTEEARNGNVIMTLPMPDGTFARFRIQQSPIIAPSLAAQLPEIKTYSGQGIDDPTATVRFGWTAEGFHASILSAKDTVYIDSYSKGDVSIYISYYTKDHRKDIKGWQCFFPGSVPTPAAKRENLSAGETLRVYRLAVAATGEYTRFHQGEEPGKEKARSAIIKTINRVNGIYERDFSIRFELIADQDKIIFTDPATDPYDNENVSDDAGKNQAVLDREIGDANYDIGHIFSTSSKGGVGAAGLCLTGGKAIGATGNPQPVGDKFDVDFVAHEVIHQFNGNHTFNSNLCGAQNREQKTAFEPGSGSTAASYAGVCQDDGNNVANLQRNSDDYFHIGSFEEVIAYVTSGERANCGRQIQTGNRPPVVNAGPNHIIPKGTPFTLTASASDPDNDALTFTWEQYDTGAASPPEEDDGTRPIFRSLRPTTSPSRTFPQLKFILNNANQPPLTFQQDGNTFLTGELLPVKNRVMKFRVTARDNRAGGGGVNNAEMTVTVRQDAGPFVITEPNSSMTWEGGSQQTVRWNVANTDAGPINASNVKISFSTDGGQTFSVLAENVPNNGVATVVAPSIPVVANRARIKVEAVGNIFFDISDADFTINASVTCTFAISSDSQSLGACGGTGSVNVTAASGCNWTVVKNDSASFVTITSSASGSGNGTVTYTVAANTGRSPRTATLTIAGKIFTIRQGITGDVDGNDSANVQDLILLIQILLGNSGATPGADVDCSSSVNVQDLIRLIQLLLGN